MSGAIDYRDRAYLKPPVWTWEVPSYFFVGGTAGMSALLALTSLLGSVPLDLARTGLWLAFLGAAISPVLLILDLGRPSRFLNMLRVFKPRSAMSVGAWTLFAFGGASTLSLALFESFSLWSELLGRSSASAVLLLAMAVTAALGVLLASYTGVLLGATVIPVWVQHRQVLPLHFALVSLGSAAALLELGDYGPSLHIVGMVVALLETALFALQELRYHPVIDRPLRDRTTGKWIRVSGALTGPLALALRFVELQTMAGLLFVVGAIMGRFAWVAAGRASARDAEAAFALQRGQ